MINKLRYIFLLAVCVSVIGIFPVSAQTDGDRVLVSGSRSLTQADVDDVIEFYEWAFEIKFNEKQRESFQQNTITEFRGDPKASRATIDDISSTLPKILAADEDVQRGTRKAFIEQFMADARKQTDENSRMLVAMYDEKQSGAAFVNADDHSHGTGSGHDEQMSNVGSLSALAGKWVWGRSGSITTTLAGAHLGGNGSRHTYTFAANGAVEYTGIMNVMTGGCNMQIYRATKGKATLSGSTLTIKWGPASFSREDSCSPSKNYRKTMPAETEVFQVKLKTDLGQKQLCMTGADEMCYSATK